MKTIATKTIRSEYGQAREVRMILKPDVYSDGTVDRWIIETRTIGGHWKHFRNICRQGIAATWFNRIRYEGKQIVC